ncbi:glycosyltransferase [Microvirga terrae]|uniref:Glycosyltransferase n=1 Tax=Microvirga terrae TaxID=2740529 RepID=A0ABY5RQ21_9HYPH|nr:glycosyltransferase family 2 protein [Microvirga terrae]UVF18394.1 glycosyltransferase [Microvirga terrae]
MSDTSVIIPTYNREAYIAQAIEGILRQTEPVREILVIDDGSTDATPQIVQKYGGIVRYCRKENSGKASSLNLAIPMTDGANIWIFDDDDIAAPTAHRALQNALNSERGHGFAFGRYLHFDRSDQSGIPVETFPLPYHERLEFQSIFIQLMERCFVFQPGMLVRRATYDKIGPFDEGLARSQDYEMLLRIAHRFSGAETSDVVFYQRRHSGQRGPATATSRFQDRESVWQSYDQRFFREWYKTLPLSAYKPSMISADERTEAHEITCLFQRLVLMGRKSLWKLAVSDLEYALELSREIKKCELSLEESRILRKLFIERPFSHLQENTCGILEMLKAEPNRSLGPEIRKNLIWAFPFYLNHFLRQADIRSAAKTVYSATNFAGSRAILSVVGARVGRKPA